MPALTDLDDQADVASSHVSYRFRPHYEKQMNAFRYIQIIQIIQIIQTFGSTELFLDSFRLRGVPLHCTAARVEPQLGAQGPSRRVKCSSFKDQR
jgi:hypothetical protein